jgi:hypothetical protein
MPSREALNDFLMRARREADVRRVVLIAGDVAAAKGPFKSSRDVAASGLIEAHGINAVSVAGYPEGHPYLEGAHAFEALAAWQGWGSRSGVRVDIVTQFCFESGPILAWLAELQERGIDLAVTVGLAGPATLATLTKFGLRCGRCADTSAASAGCSPTTARTRSCAASWRHLRPLLRRYRVSTCFRLAVCARQVDGSANSSANCRRRQRRREARSRTRRAAP